MLCLLLVLSLGAVSMLAAPAPPPAASWPLNFTRPDLEVGKRLAAWHASGGQGKPEEQGTYFQGDIILPDPPALTRNGIGYSNYRWPGAVVPYVIASAFTGTVYNNIKAAMSHIQSLTCVRFVPRTSQVDYLSVQMENSGCWATIGRKGGVQKVNLQNYYCTDVGTAVHELMHALGFFHEHTRDDRDKFVSINYQNVQQGQAHNFDIWPYTKFTYGTSYDYASIMHYTATAFSSNGQPTLVAKVAGAKMGLSTRLTAHDVALIKGMYNCP